MNRLEAARKLPANRDAVRQFAINQSEKILRDAGVEDPGMPAVTSIAPKVGESQPLQAETIKIYPEISLEGEWQRQAQGLVNLGFHSELGLTEEEYLESLPKFTSQPDSFKGRLDTPVLVETRISPKRQSELAGIQYFLDGLDVKDWDKDPKSYTTPKTPYSIWLEDGKRNLNKKPEDIRKKLKGDERGGTEFDGIALYMSNPKILEHHFLDLPGTSVGSGYAPFLRLWSGGPELGDSFVDIAGPGFGSVVCGRQK